MAKKGSESGKGQRREQSLSREQIIQAAIALLDESGEEGLTFRALSERLATGPGAIYWHIANKNDLMTAACDELIGKTIREASLDGTPQENIRLLGLAMFDAMDAHPWLGSALMHAPQQSPMLHIVERVGQQLKAMGVPKTKHWISASTLLNYILGVGGRNAANGVYARANGLNRTTALDAIATAWLQLDAGEYPFVRSLAAQLRMHDDRKDFAAGIALILKGISPN
jgi:AcrR family transcriptional regulator